MSRKKKISTFAPDYETDKTHYYIISRTGNSVMRHIETISYTTEADNRCRHEAHSRRHHHRRNIR